MTVERVERAVEFAVYVVEKYGDVYTPILTRLRVDLAEMRQHQLPAVECGPRPPRPFPDQSEITEDTPLHLETAARLAFPDGMLTGLTLQDAASQGELEHERLGGRLFTTLKWIGQWRERNRYPARQVNLE